MVRTSRSIAVCLAVLLLLVGAAGAEPAFQDGPPPIQSMGALAFGPDGVLFAGDGKAGAVFALDLGAQQPGTMPEHFSVADVETKIAALLGTRDSEVLIHDMAVHPVSRAVYLAVSRGRARWESRWQLPNDLAEATVLLSIGGSGAVGEVEWAGVGWAQTSLPNPVDPAKAHPWKEGASLRADTITDMVYDDGSLWIAGLSNEEFASTLWRVAYPFEGAVSKTTVEIYHGAHGAWETHAPIRTFVPYALRGERYLLAAYLCTPLVTFDSRALTDGAHVKGRTVAEFGSGNYPLDMVVYRKGEKEKLLIANSALPMMIVDPSDIERFEGEITSEVEGYTAGVPYEIRSGGGVLQMDLLDEQRIVALQRNPSGTLDLVSLPVARF